SPDGAWYSRVDARVDVDLEAIGALSDGTLVIAGDRGQLLVSADDARSWRSVEHGLGQLHLWSLARFGGGALIGGGGGRIARLAAPDDATWSERADDFGNDAFGADADSLDEIFAAGPDGFIASGLAAYLDARSAGGASGNGGNGHRAQRE